MKLRGTQSTLPENEGLAGRISRTLRSKTSTCYETCLLYTSSIAIYGLIATVNCYHDPHVDAHKQTKTFSVKTALLFAAIIAIILIASAALNAWFGQAGLVVASSVAGLADVHAAVISITSFVASGKISIQSAVIPILVAFSVNTLVKAVIAQVTGGTQFARLVVPALAIQVVAVWLGWWLM